MLRICIAALLTSAVAGAAPSGNYHGITSLATTAGHPRVILDITADINSATLADFDIKCSDETILPKVKCSGEVIAISDTAVTFPNITTTGDCMGDALRGQNRNVTKYFLTINSDGTLHFHSDGYLPGRWFKLRTPSVVHRSVPHNQPWYVKLFWMFCALFNVVWVFLSLWFITRQIKQGCLAGKLRGAARSQQAQATITKKHEDEGGGEGGVAHRISYKFHARRGDGSVTEFIVTQQHISSAAFRKLEEGDTAAVRYLPEEPRACELEADLNKTCLEGLEVCCCDGTSTLPCLLPFFVGCCVWCVSASGKVLIIGSAAVLLVGGLVVIVAACWRPRLYHGVKTAEEAEELQKQLLEKAEAEGLLRNSAP